MKLRLPDKQQMIQVFYTTTVSVVVAIYKKPDTLFVLKVGAIAFAVCFAIAVLGASMGDEDERE